MAYLSPITNPDMQIIMFVVCVHVKCVMCVAVNYLVCKFLYPIYLINC